mmetsp:Transcript_107886/g.300847  ORF Transcript_107886/g.300847 Transcript_107886/m.300847 type:complete len:242 (-) Transcript_107886:327-1052(-)
MWSAPTAASRSCARALACRTSGAAHCVATWRVWSRLCSAWTSRWRACSGPCVEWRTAWRSRARRCVALPPGRKSWRSRLSRARRHSRTCGQVLRPSPRTCRRGSRAPQRTACSTVTCAWSPGSASSAISGVAAARVAPRRRRWNPGRRRRPWQRWAAAATALASSARKASWTRAAAAAAATNPSASAAAAPAAAREGAARAPSAWGSKSTWTLRCGRGVRPDPWFGPRSTEQMERTAASRA